MSHGLESLHKNIGSPAWFWPVVMVILFALFALGSSCTPMEDHGSDFARADKLLAKQGSAAAEARRAKAAQDECTRKRGPNAVIVQMVDGSSRCADKRGRNLNASQIAQVQP